MTSRYGNHRRCFNSIYVLHNNFVFYSRSWYEKGGINDNLEAVKKLDKKIDLMLVPSCEILKRNSFIIIRILRSFTIAAALPWGVVGKGKVVIDKLRM